MKRLTCILVMAAVMTAGQALAQQYDLAINGGRVMDPETMYDGIANVGIKDGKIAAITKDKIAGKEAIDATGLVVAPGFIDTHYHAVDPFATRMALRQGITTGMDLELGALHVGRWYDDKAKEGWQNNYGTTANLIMTRLAVHDPEVKIEEPVDASNLPRYLKESDKDGKQGWSVTSGNIDQMNAIMKILDEDLREGALGVGAGVAYMSRGLKTYELFEAQRAASHYGRLTSVHTRFHLSTKPPTESQIGADEVIANAVALKAPLIIAHDNDYGWWENEEKLRLLREQGFNMWAEYYPYDAAGGQPKADFFRPEIWEGEYGYKYEETIFDPQANKFLNKEEFLSLRKSDPTRAIVTYFPARKKWLPYWLRMPDMTVASDAIAGRGENGRLLPADAHVSEYRGHPRTAGASVRALRLGREQGVPLMFTLSQLSYWSAKHLGDTGLEAMKQRGRVQVGKAADLTLFDPKTVADNANFRLGENGLPPTGVPYVIINGTVVVKEGKVLPVKPGQPIRFPVEAKGRFEPVTVNKWFGDHVINVPDMHGMDDSGAGHITTDK